MTDNIIKAGMLNEFPTFISRVVDEWQYSVISAIVVIGLLFVEIFFHVPIHRVAVALAAGTMALLALSLTAVTSSIPSLLMGKYENSGTPKTSLLRVIAIIWVNISWIFWITIVTFIIGVIAQFGLISWIGAATPGLALLAILRTYLAARESFRTYMAIVHDRFEE